jgi:hypothetical protein
MGRAKEMIPPAIVEQIKHRLWQGIKPIDIQDEFMLQNGTTISLIKKGRKYGHIPWPNGKVGSLQEARTSDGASKLSFIEDTKIGQSPDAIEYSGFSPKSQEDIRLAVNDFLEKNGGVPFPPIAVAYEQYLNHPTGDGTPVEEAQRKEYAIQSEDRRRSGIMQTFERIKIELRQQREKEKLEAERAKWRALPKSDYVAPPPPPFDPLREEKLSWDDVLRLAGDHALVIEASEKDNESLKWAIAIIFANRELPRSQWHSDAVAKIIRGIAEEIAKWQSEHTSAHPTHHALA